MQRVYVVLTRTGYICGCYATREAADKAMARLIRDSYYCHDELRISDEPILQG